MSLPNCFECSRRQAKSGKPCPYISDCIAGNRSNFRLLRKEQTRGDKIRHMSDEQLAELFARLRPDMNRDNKLKEHLLDWLGMKTEYDVTDIWFMHAINIDFDHFPVIDPNKYVENNIDDTTTDELSNKDESVSDNVETELNESEKIEMAKEPEKAADSGSIGGIEKKDNDERSDDLKDSDVAEKNAITKPENAQFNDVVVENIVALEGPDETTDTDMSTTNKATEDIEKSEIAVKADESVKCADAFANKIEFGTEPVNRETEPADDTDETFDQILITDENPTPEENSTILSEDTLLALMETG